VQVKDLGPQIPYSAVFFWEYFGPLVIFPLFYMCGAQIYPALGLPKPKPSVQQGLACAYWAFHYLKRIVETFTVHKFSHATMPIFNLFKNCSYYWGFAAIVGYFCNHPLYTSAPLPQVQALLALALVCQLGNALCHIQLASLRSGGKTGYQIPQGWMFRIVACPNYTCEILGWVLFTAATRTLWAGIFTLAGAAQMTEWAVKKYSRLRKLFGNAYPKRWIILPPIY